jgi:uncharacterized membrane protein
MLDGKHPVTSLAGPYGHPLHPAVVAVPLGTWSASVLFDLASQVVAHPQFLVRGAAWLLATGVLGALVAAALGLLDLLAIPPGTAAMRTAVLHAALSSTALVLFTGSLVWRLGRLDADGTPGGPLALSLLALAVVGASGFLGGELAYRHGVRVTHEQDQHLDAAAGRVH